VVSQLADKLGCLIRDVRSIRWDTCSDDLSGRRVERHSSLEAFSRDHHIALVIAQRLKRALEATADEARSAFLSYWRSQGREHFREEEEILLPTFAGFGDPDAPVVAEVLIDHVRIRRFAMELASGSPDVEVLHALGTRLEQHVRREERELFPLIEQAVPETELARLASLLSR
jgi:iron-sulfur cluster repair protein YtfE (RIC family)